MALRQARARRPRRGVAQGTLTLTLTLALALTPALALTLSLTLALTLTRWLKGDACYEDAISLERTSRHPLLDAFKEQAGGLR